MLQAFVSSRVNFYPSTLPGGKPRNSIQHHLKLQVKRVAVTCASVFSFIFGIPPGHLNTSPPPVVQPSSQTPIGDFIRERDEEKERLAVHTTFC